MLKGNLSIVSGSAPGLLLSIWLNLQAVKLQYARSYSTEMRKILLQNSLEGQTVEFARHSIESDAAGEQYHHLEADDALTDIDEEEERSGSNSSGEESIDIEQAQRMPLHLQQPHSQQQRHAKQKQQYQHPEQPLQHQNKDGHQRSRQQPHHDDDVVRTSITAQQAAQQNSQSQLSGQHRHSQVIRVDQNHMKGGPNGIGDFDLLVLNVHSSMSKIRTTATQETVLLVVCAIWVFIILCLSFIPGISSTDATSVVGIAVNLNLVIFYGSPLSTIYTVIQTGVSETIHIPTMILNSFNGGLWGVFGLVTGDPYVTLPNSVGFFLGVVQMILCLIFPREIRETIVTESGDVLEHSTASQRHRRTVVMISSQNLNDMESLSVLSLVHPSKHSRHAVRIYNNNSLSNLGYDASGHSNRYGGGNSSINTAKFNNFVLPSDYSQSTRRKIQAQKAQHKNNNMSTSDMTWGNGSMVGGPSGHYRNQVSDFLEALGNGASSGGTSTTADESTDQKVERLWL
jgi:Sugar efflux transporter for intercellular exchange